MEEILFIDTKIYTARGIQVMIDSDLALLYGVETKRINEAVKNNIDKFPFDFYFELSEDEEKILKSKISTSSWGGRRKSINVFTEQGVYMLATVLKSKIATEVTIAIMRTFTKLKNLSVPYFDLIKRLEELEVSRIENDELLKKVINIVSQMQELQREARQNTKKIGFKINDEK